jgi:light-regulated signal transduction histidine kinase (bacteriophytochrome)
VSARNVTERKLAELQLYELTEQLEKKVQERTRKLEDVNQELSDFAYVVSHDLKAPLRGITQLGGWLSEDYADQLDDEAQNMVSLMVTRTKRMHRLIEGILQYSRIGRITEQQASINLNKMLQETVELLAPPENITISIHDLPTITGEPTRIQQLFQNLISNAIKYMDKAEGQVEISAIGLASHWQFSVIDNGPGIAEKYHEKVFQIFQSLNSYDTVDSTGIGLAIAKKIVDLHDGRIWIKSSVGEGTTFFFTLAKTLETSLNAE